MVPERQHQFWYTSSRKFSKHTEIYNPAAPSSRPKVFIRNGLSILETSTALARWSIDRPSYLRALRTISVSTKALHVRVYGKVVEDARKVVDGPLFYPRSPLWMREVVRILIHRQLRAGMACMLAMGNLIQT